MYKGIFSSDLLINTPYFIKLKRETSRYKPVLDLIGERTPGLTLYIKLFVELIKIVIISIRIYKEYYKGN